MIDQSLAAPVKPEAARLPTPPVRPEVGRFLVLGCVFVCAACGLVYELELLALASYLIGDSVTQASIVLSVMVFAMGVGSLLAKRLCCRPAAGFGFIEATLALVGGGSTMALYACFAWFGESRTALVAFSLAIGVLIGAEMPLLMTLIQRIRVQDAGGAVADLFAADYVGALVGGLAFPFLLLPFLGQLTGALLVGVVNVLAGSVVVLWLFRRDFTNGSRWVLRMVNAVVVLLLGTAVVFAGSFEKAARRAVYGDEVRVAVRTDVQEVVLTERDAAGDPGPGELEMFIDGRLRVCGAEEARYHQALVHPAMASGPHTRVLVLGGGDGLALREVLRHRGVRAVTVVDIDPGVIELARTDERLSVLNKGSLDDPRVRLEVSDAFHWLREWRGAGAAPYDVIISGLPDPRITDSTKLYSQEFYGLARRALADGGRIAVHAGAAPASGDRREFWTVDATLRAAGLRTAPYAVGGRAASGFTSGPDRSRQRRTDGERWGFLLAAAESRPPLRARRAEALGETELRHAAVVAERGRVAGLPPSTLTHPRYLR
jgi:spermidine synthase